MAERPPDSQLPQRRPPPHANPSPVSDALQVVAELDAECRREEERDHRFRFQSHCRCLPSHLNSETFLVAVTRSGVFLTARHFVCPQSRDHVAAVAARVANRPLAEQWAIQQRHESSRLRRLRARVRRLDITARLRLELLALTDHGDVYTTVVGTQTFAVKLAGGTTELLDEYETQNQAHGALRLLWNHVVRMLGHDRLVHERRPSVPRASYLVSTSIKPFGRKGFLMDYVQPLQPAYRVFLARKYLHPSVHEAIMAHPGWETLSLLAYLGERRPEADELSIHVHGRPVHVDTVLAEVGRRGLEALAMKMGVTLAVVHWGCQLDARGVKFQFGLTATGQATLWMLDFGGCQPFDLDDDELPATLARAVAGSPFWPRAPWAHGFTHDDEAPESVTLAWRAFSKSYINASFCLVEMLLPQGWMPELAQRDGGRFNIFADFIQALKGGGVSSSVAASGRSRCLGEYAVNETSWGMKKGKQLFHKIKRPKDSKSMTSRPLTRPALYNNPCLHL